jgi:hypothetical protein
MAQTTTDQWAAEWQEELNRREAEGTDAISNELNELALVAWTENLPHVRDALRAMGPTPATWLAA